MGIIILGWKSDDIKRFLEDLPRKSQEDSPDDFPGNPPEDLYQAGKPFPEESPGRVPEESKTRKTGFPAEYYSGRLNSGGRIFADKIS